MKITLHLVLSIIIAVSIVAGISSYFSVQSEKERLGGSLEHRAWLVAEGMKESVGMLLAQGPSKKLDKLVEKISTSEQVFGVVVYDPAGKVISVSKELSGKLPDKLDIIFEKFEGDSGKGLYKEISTVQMYLFALPVFNDEGAITGTIVIFSDASYIDKYLKDILFRNF